MTKKLLPKTSLSFDPVEASPPKSSKIRDDDGGTLSPSGLVKLNANGSDTGFTVIQDSGEDETNALFKCAVNKANRLIGVYPVPFGTTGTIRFTVTTRKGSHTRFISFDLDSVFAEHPTLRPNGKRQVAVRHEIDAEGKHCLVIDLQTAQIKRTVSRKSSSGSADAPKSKKAKKSKQQAEQLAQPAAAAQKETEQKPDKAPEA